MRKQRETIPYLRLLWYFSHHLNPSHTSEVFSRSTHPSTHLGCVWSFFPCLPPSPPSSFSHTHPLGPARLKTALSNTHLARELRHVWLCTFTWWRCMCTYIEFAGCCIRTLHFSGLSEEIPTGWGWSSPTVPVSTWQSPCCPPVAPGVLLLMTCVCKQSTQYLFTNLGF